MAISSRSIRKIYLTLLILTSCGLAGFFAMMSFPLSVQRDWYSFMSQAAYAQLKSYQQWGIGFLVVGLGSSFFVGLGDVRQNIKVNMSLFAWWAVACTYFMVSFLWSIDPVGTLIYAMAMPLLLFLSVTFWALPQSVIRIQALICAITIFSAMVYLALTLHLTHRTFGGITPNLLAHFGYAMGALAILSNSRARWCVLASGVALVIYAQARTVAISMLAFFVFYYVLIPLVDRRNFFRTLFGGVLSAVAGALLIEPIVSWLSQFSTEVLGVNDISRGANSGFTGRGTLWNYGFELALRQPLFGYGFRTRGTVFETRGSQSLNVHSGLLNCVLDTGVIGLLMFVAIYSVSVVVLLQQWARSGQREDRLAVAFMLAMIPTLVVEPNYLNFSHPTSFILILCLGRALGKFAVERPGLIMQGAAVENDGVPFGANAAIAK